MVGDSVVCWKIINWILLWYIDVQNRAGYAQLSSSLRRMRNGGYSWIVQSFSYSTEKSQPTENFTQFSRLMQFFLCLSLWTAFDLVRLSWFQQMKLELRKGLRISKLTNWRLPDWAALCWLQFLSEPPPTQCQHWKIMWTKEKSKLNSSFTNNDADFGKLYFYFGYLFKAEMFCKLFQD